VDDPDPITADMLKQLPLSGQEGALGDTEFRGALKKAQLDWPWSKEIMHYLEGRK